MSFLSAEKQEKFKELLLKICSKQADILLAFMDNDQDGKLTLEEWTACCGNTKVEKKLFESTDLNKDGKVDRVEMIKYIVDRFLPNRLDILEQKLDGCWRLI